jgi:hypothetical protein
LALEPEQLFGTIAGKIFGNINKFASAVIALAWIPLGIFIGHHRPAGLHDGSAGKIFRSDELKCFSLADRLIGYSLKDLFIVHLKDVGIHRESFLFLMEVYLLWF